MPKLFFLILIMMLNIRSFGTNFVQRGNLRCHYNETLLYGRVNAPLINKSIIIVDTLDLHGKKWVLPEGITLKIRKGGQIKNGSIVGARTRLEGGKHVFGKIEIEGSWDVTEISTEMFTDLDYVNSLRNVFALTSPIIKNKVIIEEGEYKLSVCKNADAAIRVQSNTEVYINGNLKLLSNSFTNYSVVTVVGDNVTINGKGSILGDRCSHHGNKGEWGMCLILSGNNICVRGVTIRDAWGDCIYITGKSNNVLIEKCQIERGRRQGISIISANHVAIRDCYINDVGGTDPGYAIDVEPNKNCIVDDVQILNVKVRQCKGAFTANGRAHGSRVGKLTIRNCKVQAVGKPVVIASKVDVISVQDCNIKQSAGDKVIAFDQVNKLHFHNNEIYYKANLAEKMMGQTKALMGLRSWPMILTKCKHTEMYGNKGL